MNDQKPKGKTWEILDSQDLNRHRNNDAEECIRQSTKKAVARALKDIYEDAEDRENSIGPSTTPLMVVIEDSNRGAKNRLHAKEGHELVHGTDEEKKARWGSYQETLEQVHAENPNWGIIACRQRAAEIHGVSEKTIYRHTIKTWN